MSNLYSRVQDIDDKIKNTSLTILQWQVLFAINESTDSETIKEFTEENDENISDSLNHLIKVGFIIEASGESSKISEEIENNDAQIDEKEEDEIESTFEVEAEQVDTNLNNEETIEDVENAVEEKQVEDLISDIVDDSDTDEEDSHDLDLSIDDDEEITNDDDIIAHTEVIEDDSNESEELELDDSKEIEEIIEEAPAEVEETIEEPIAEADIEMEEAVPTSPTAKAENEGNGTGKIVVADESIVIRKMVELALEDHGYEIIGYSSGKELIDNLDSDKPSIVIVDLSLSDINGVEILKKIKNSKGIPVLMFASKNAPADMEKAESSGCDGFIQKPFKDEDLLEKVKSLI